ncbi:hypothetical protein LCGC14_2310720 [marine sediment metagenome]|uniref:Uncharacterized protein n=1 Tax=marine sediment metagenome TaxID=412755 RepID=A0A0F9CL82_9ZZZZ
MRFVTFTRPLVLAAIVLAGGICPAGTATVAFTSDGTGSFPRTVKAERGRITVDLSALGRGVVVRRAVLRPQGPITGRYGRDVFFFSS